MVKCLICVVSMGWQGNIKTVLYAFLASGRSRNHAAYMKDSSLQQYITATSCHHCFIADSSQLSLEIVGFCTRVRLLVEVENTKET